MNGYPALLDLGTNRVYPLREKSSFLVGRSREADIPVLDREFARQQFRIVRNGEFYLVEGLSENVPTHLDGQPVQGPQRLKHGNRISAGNQSYRYLIRPDDTPARTPPEPQAPARSGGFPQLPPDPPSDATVFAPADAAAGGEATLGGAITIDGLGAVLIGREVSRVQVLLPHPHVSRFHAQIAMQQSQAVIADLRSANGTFVNGRRIVGPTALRVGDRIDIGPFTLVFTGKALVPKSRSGNIELIGRNLRREVLDRQTRTPRTLLDGVTLAIRPREFACILGPSGCGKSTLLSALSARAPTDSGDVLVNRQNLYTNFDSLKRDMVVVPQKDALYEALTVDQSLRFTARLRLPADTSDSELRQCVDDMLAAVDLTAHRDTSIRDLSGGQLKRASLASELIAKPTLVFLDEVTSGLDEMTDREMMRLFRALAEGGKTVVCITHSLANVEINCHLVVVLAAGGKLSFVGSPAEALAFFQIARLGDVYEKLKEKDPDFWMTKFRGSDAYRKYVVERVPSAQEADTLPPPPQPPALSARLAETFRQALILLRRQATVLSRDTRPLLAMAGQSILVAFLLIVIFGNLDDKKKKVDDYATSARTMLFLLQVSCLWFGCNNAAKEIVKERVLCGRERDFNLQATSYFLSKFALLTAISCAQSMLLYAAVSIFCNPPGTPAVQAAFLAVASVCGVSIGLAISALSRTEDFAVTLVPIVLIPQIVLANAIAPLDGLGELLGKLFVCAFWVERGMIGSLPDNLRTKAESHSAAVSFGVLLLQAAIFGGIALAALLTQRQSPTQAILGWFRKVAGSRAAGP